MRKRNLIADAFFEGVSAFSEQSGAVGFDSRAEYSGIRKKGELSKMICVAGYKDYDIEYVYTASGGLIFYSVFNFRVIFDRSMPYVKYSPYDLMYKIDESDFTCYTFGYIESPERMSQVIAGLTPALNDLLPKLDELSRRKDDLSDIFDKFSDGVNAYFGRDVFRASNIDDENFERMLGTYYLVDDSFYVSKPYALFLRGDYITAYNGMHRLRFKSYYQMRLMSFISSLDHRYEAVKNGCDTTGDGVFSGKVQLVRSILSVVILLLPCAAALAGIHFLCAAIIYRGALWSDAWAILNAFRYITSAIVPAFALSRYVRGVTLPFYNRQRRKYLSALDKISVNKRTGCLSIITGIMTVAIVVTVIFSANSYAAFYENRIRLPSESSLIASDSYAYTDVEKLVHETGSYSVYGSLFSSDEYILVLENGGTYALSYEVTNNVIEQKIIPILEEKGIPVVSPYGESGVE